MHLTPPSTMMTLLYFFRPKVAIYVQRAECTTHAGLVAQVWDHTIDTPHCLVALLIVNKAWAALTRIYLRDFANYLRPTCRNSR